MFINIVSAELYCHTGKTLAGRALALQDFAGGSVIVMAARDLFAGVALMRVIKLDVVKELGLSSFNIVIDLCRKSYPSLGCKISSDG